MSSSFHQLAENFNVGGFDFPPLPIHIFLDGLFIFFIHCKFATTAFIPIQSGEPKPNTGFKKNSRNGTKITNLVILAAQSEKKTN